MKLVLLPGMDGSGRLFDNFLSFYGDDNQIIVLPTDIPQDYPSLANYVTTLLPAEDCIILAESFSGGIVPHLINGSNQQIKGIIFVASFLSCPNRTLIEIAKRLPIKIMSKLPFSDLIQRYLFFDNKTSPEQLSLFNNILESIPSTILRARFNTMIGMQAPSQPTTIPAVYIQATRDKLVSADKWLEISNLFDGIKRVQIMGPHFVLQSLPEESARRVFEAVFFLTPRQALKQPKQK